MESPQAASVAQISSPGVKQFLWPFVDSAEATEQLRELIDWGQDNGVEFGPAKTEVMHFPRKRDTDNPIVTHGTTRKRAEASMRRLGVFLDRKLTFRDHVKHWTGKASRVANHIRSICNTVRGLPVASTRKAGTSCMIPVLTHGLEAGTQDGIGRDRSVLRTAMRAILPVWRTHPSHILHFESQMPPAEILAESIRRRHGFRLGRDRQRTSTTAANPTTDVAGPSMNTLGLQYVPEVGKREQHPYPMVISFTLSSGNWIDLGVKYDQRIVATQQASNLAHHFQAILTQLSTAREDTLVKSLSPFSDNDFAQIAQWNRNTPNLEETCVDQLFHMQVLIQPSSIAVRSLEQSLTYLDVDTYSSSLAAQLIEIVASPGDYVGVCFEKSIWTAVAIMAVFKAGCIYVPIDPAHPQGRIREIVRTVGINVAMTSQSGANALHGLCDQVIVINKSPVPPPGPIPNSRSHPHAIAYLLFTSGSTGKPKGILIPHAAICTSIRHHGRAFGANPQWKTLQFCAHTFDISIGEFLTTLAYGGCICVPSEFDRLNNLAEAITALEANTLLVVPTVANLLQPKDVPTLKTIVLGGEPVPQEIITRWADHVNLICSYGPSECAVWSSANLGASSQAHPAHIGRSIGGTMWVANPSNHSQLSAIGCIGEIVISGPILGRGYFGDTATTDAAFLPAPAWLRKVDPTSPYDKVYRTGDLARYNPDGTFHIVGRLDTQVKLRGFRIELCEIENQIMATGTATAALAQLPRTGPCANQIVAVLSYAQADLGNPSGSPIVVSTDDRIELDDTKAHVRFTLPQYMVPSVWIVLERMPLLISGKVDRKSIKVWTDSMDEDTYDRLMDNHDHVDTDAIVPGSLSDSLRSLWGEALSIPADRIGKQTSFFSLGGDSLAAMQIVSRAKELGLRLTVRGILGTSNLGDLAILTKKQSSAEKSLAQDIHPGSAASSLDDYEELETRLKGRSSVQIEDSYTLSPGQREISRARKGNPDLFLLLWNMKISPPETQPVTLDKLAEAWKCVVQKYPILRTIFLQAEGNLPALQVVLADVEPEITISSAGANETMPTAVTAGLKHVDDCFLPHRAHFIRHGDSYFGNIELNHMLIDGWSLRFIRQAFLDAYDVDEAIDVGQPPSYKSYIATLRPDRVQADERHWVSILRDQEPSLLSPSPAKSYKQPESNSSKTVIHLQAVKARSLSSFSADNGITLASIVDAAWAQTLSLHTHSSNVTFAYVNSGRDEDIPGVSEIVGPLINILAYHLHGVSTRSSPETLASLARKMQQQRGEDSAHTSCSISEVVEDILHLDKLFNTGVNFQRRPTSMGTQTLRVDDLLDESKDPWHFDVLLRVTHITDENVLKISFEFDAQKFNEEQVNDIAESFCHARTRNTIEGRPDADPDPNARVREPLSPPLENVSRSLTYEPVINHGTSTPHQIQDATTQVQNNSLDPPAPSRGEVWFPSTVASLLVPSPVGPSDTDHNTGETQAKPIVSALS
ncbi:hypothetical protein TruAng_011923 [Truncatella angustata]|nr:hypothetical protein TruAng_011923 [Truncatella angustata]